MPLSEQELLRRQKREELMSRGIDPYPAETFEVTATAKDIHKNYPNNKLDYKQVSLAGRLMSFRIMGNASFAELQDSTGRIQLYFRRDDLCPGEDKSLYNHVFKKLLDIGDIIGVDGFVFTTNTGEISVHVQAFRLLSKSLRPLPVVKTDDAGQVHDGFTDPELRYRQRYVDLIVNPNVREVFIKRAKTITTMRRFFDDRNWLEVETPVLQNIHGGAAAKPFRTHHNALDTDLFLRIATELHLKRLIVGGFEGVYEFGKLFRNEGMDRTHNPEFTTVELYVAYKDYHWMMRLVEELLEQVATAVTGAAGVQFGDQKLNFAGPYPRLSIVEAIEKYTGLDVTEASEEEIRKKCRAWGIDGVESIGRGKLIDEIFSEKVEEHIIQPTYITDHPTEMSPLTKKHREKPGHVERFELFVNGREIANAYSELNDPIDQRERFEEQLKLKERGDDEAMLMDEDFLRALDYGMPPTAGIGIGIDRLVMMFTNNLSIQEVILFPQMRPERKEEEASDADFLALGIPEVWIPAVRKMGLATVNAVKEANPNKIFNDFGGLRKKLKIEEKLPTLDEIRQWQV